MSKAGSTNMTIATTNITSIYDYSVGYAQAFTKWEVILLTIINLTLVLIAVVGNAIVCVLLRFRYMRVFRYVQHWCCNRGTRAGAQFYRDSAPHELWAEEYASSQQECSCGKTYPHTPSGLMNNRYVIFTPGRKLPIAYTSPMDANHCSTRSNKTRLSGQTHPGRSRLVKRHIRVGQQSSITSLFLFNLSLADFLMALLIIPIHVIVEIIYLSWPLGYTMCKLFSYLQGISVFVSALTHVVISWDRVVLVYFPLRPRISHRSAVGLIVGVWILACIIPFPMLVVNQLHEENFSAQCVEDWTVLFPNLIVNRTSNPPQFLFEMDLWIGAHLVVDISSAYTVLLMILQYFLPLGVICGTYAAIVFRVRRLQTPGERDQMRDQKLNRARQKMVKMLITVAILYGLSQLPRHIVYLHGSLHREFWQTSWSVRLWTAVSFTRDSSTCYNPFIYAWVNKNYRHEVYRLLRPLCAPCRLMRKRFTQIYREFRHRGLRETNRHPVTTTNSASLPGTHIRSVFFKDTYDDVRVVNSVPNFGAQAPVLSNCYSVTLPIQNPDTGAVAPIVQHMSMISLSR